MSGKPDGFPAECSTALRLLNASINASWGGQMPACPADAAWQIHSESRMQLALAETGFVPAQLTEQEPAFRTFSVRSMIVSTKLLK